MSKREFMSCRDIIRSSPGYESCPEEEVSLDRMNRFGDDDDDDSLGGLFTPETSMMQPASEKEAEGHTHLKTPDPPDPLFNIRESIDDFLGEIRAAVEMIEENIKTDRSHKSVTVENKNYISTAGKNITSLSNNFGQQLIQMCKTLLVVKTIQASELDLTIVPPDAARMRELTTTTTTTARRTATVFTQTDSPDATADDPPEKELPITTNATELINTNHLKTLFNELKQETAKQIKQEVQTLRREIRSLTHQSDQSANRLTNSKDTYAAAATAKSRPLEPAAAAPATSKPAIIISSTNGGDGAPETLQAWRKSVTFRDTDFAPVAAKFISNGKVRVEFNSKQERDVALSKTNDINAEVVAETSRSLRPMVVLKGVSVDVPAEDLVDIVTNQNQKLKETINDTNKIKVHFKKGNKNPKLYNAVLMTTPSTFNAIMKLNKLNVDHQRVHVEEHVPLLHCYKCLQFGHTRKHCKQENDICSYSADPTHEFKTCPHREDKSKMMCHNCKTHNQQQTEDKNLT